MWRIIDTMQEFIDRQTGVRSIMCEIAADTAADLPANTAERVFILGTFATAIDTGDIYKINSAGSWILQPSQNAFSNVYTKYEIDDMITSVYRCIMYYHSELISTTGTITFYTFDDFIYRLDVYGNTRADENTLEFVGTKTDNIISLPFVTVTIDGATIVSSGDTITITGDITNISTSNSAWKQFDFMLDSGTYTISLGAPRQYQSGYAPRLHKYSDDSVICDYIAGGSISKMTFTLSERTHVYIAYYIVNKQLSNDKWIFMLNTGDTAFPFEPTGYKIPIICAGETITIHTGAPLRMAIDGTNAVDIMYNTGTITRAVDENGNALVTPTTETIDFPYIPTTNGENTLTVDTELKPSKIVISGE